MPSKCLRMNDADIIAQVYHEQTLNAEEVSENKGSNNKSVGGGRHDPHPGHVMGSAQEGGAQWAPPCSHRVPLGSCACAHRCVVVIVG